MGERGPSQGENAPTLRSASISKMRLKGLLSSREELGVRKWAELVVVSSADQGMLCPELSLFLGEMFWRYCMLTQQLQQVIYFLGSFSSL